MTDRLVGPMPSQDAPAYPTPWYVQGDEIFDATDRQVADTMAAGEKNAYELAHWIVRAVNQTYHDKGAA